MASPSIASVGASQTNPANTSSTVVIPSGIANGNLLIAAVFLDSIVGPSGWPAGWVVMPRIDQSSSSISIVVAYKFATGSETNFTLTHGSSLTRTRCYRITGHAGPTRPPLMCSWQGASSAGPVGVTPNEWKQPQDILSILMTTWENQTPSPTPTGYTNEFNGSAAGARCETKAISSFSGTEDPANYTTGSGNRVGFTILVASDSDDPDLTYPIVRNWMDTTSSAALSSSVSVVIPKQAEAGDICVVAMSFITARSISSGIPAGWTTQVNQGGGGSGGETLIVLWKRLDGTETDFTLTLSGTTAWYCSSFSILNVDSDATVLSASANNGPGSDATPNPPSLSADADLWMAVAEEEATALSSFPANYTHKQSNNSNGIYVAFRQLSATSEDPGVFTVASNHFWAAATIAFGKANPRLFQASWS